MSIKAHPPLESDSENPPRRFRLLPMGGASRSFIQFLARLPLTLNRCSAFGEGDRPGKRSALFEPASLEVREPRTCQCKARPERRPSDGCALVRGGRQQCQSEQGRHPHGASLSLSRMSAMARIARSASVLQTDRFGDAPAYWAHLPLDRIRRLPRAKAATYCLQVDETSPPQADSHNVAGGWIGPGCHGPAAYATAGLSRSNSMNFGPVQSSGTGDNPISR